jgi:hypothetical protein
LRLNRLPASTANAVVAVLKALERPSDGDRLRSFQLVETFEHLVVFLEGGLLGPVAFGRPAKVALDTINPARDLGQARFQSAAQLMLFVCHDTLLTPQSGIVPVGGNISAVLV